jgi:hypothetical protein
MSTELPATHSERVTMTLLSEIEPAISDVLNLLGNHMTKRIEDIYYFYASNTSMTLSMHSSSCEASTVSTEHVCWSGQHLRLC